jgi:uncharacterized protein YjbJ (UPF0337 family)
MKTKSVLAVASVCFLLGLGGIGCEKEGPAERAGKKLDQAAEKLKDTVEEVSSELKGEGPAEKLGEKVDEAAESAKEKAKEATNP